jgi:hypothetical protein
MSKFPEKNNLSYDYAVHFDSALIVILWTAIFILSAYYLIKKRDL